MHQFCPILIIHLDTDASDVAIGAELLQVQNGEEKVISYRSFSLTPCQRKYCTTHKELLPIVRFCREYHHYLLGHRFIICTDHGSLTWLMCFQHIEGQLARWLEELSQFDMMLQHCPGQNMAMLMGCPTFPKRDIAIAIKQECTCLHFLVEDVSIALGCKNNGVSLKTMWMMWYPLPLDLSKWQMKMWRLRKTPIRGQMGTLPHGYPSTPQNSFRRSSSRIQIFPS